MNLRKTGNTRKTGKEQFYTKPEVVDRCIAIALPYLSPGQVIVEPAGGTGEFIDGLRRAGLVNEILSCDIEPKHPDVTLGDYLDGGLSPAVKGTLTISNPPFGRCNSLSKKFFNEAATHSETIAFLVPKSWRKWSVQNALDLNFWLVEDIEMPAICFYNEETGLDHAGGALKTVFQVWQRRDTKREKVCVPDLGLISKSSPAEADVAITAFGWSCGRVEVDFERVPNTTKMYLKVSGPEVVKALQSVDYSVFYENTAYTYALGIQEIRHLVQEFQANN